MDDFNITYDQKTKDLSISNRIISICAYNAASKTKGVHRLVKNKTENVTSKIFRKESLTKGVKVTQNKEGINIDLYIIVEYGLEILTVAWDVQTNVKNRVEEMTDKTVAKVNVYVQGVDLPV